MAEGSIAMSRIHTATLRQATEDVRDFEVVVSEQDADQIERTNDAISRLGLVWRGLSNQLAVAAAPALEAVADALAMVASRVVHNRVTDGPRCNGSDGNRGDDGRRSGPDGRR